MKILIACERSGVLRRAFRKLGHDAWSCDLVPADDGSKYHIQNDAIKVAYDIKRKWDLMVAHPECKFLCNSGAKHLYKDCKKINGKNPKRWRQMRKGAEFYNKLRDAPIKKKAIENPIMHGHAIKLCGKATQFVQPWWFGDKAFKATGFRLYNLPKLEKTKKLKPPIAGTIEHKEWSFIHRMHRIENRSVLRSKTFPGMADAIAEQWG